MCTTWPRRPNYLPTTLGVRGKAQGVSAPSYSPEIVFPSLRNVLLGDSLREIGVETEFEGGLEVTPTMS